jgi:hypothetical protein
MGGRDEDQSTRLLGKIKCGRSCRDRLLTAKVTFDVVDQRVKKRASGER